MTLVLHGHPFSSYTWKALIALYANGTAFELDEFKPGDADNAALRAELLALPEVARCIEDAPPFRARFPPGAPDRD